MRQFVLFFAKIAIRIENAKFWSSENRKHGVIIPQLLLLFSILIVNFATIIEI